MRLSMVGWVLLIICWCGAIKLGSWIGKAEANEGQATLIQNLGVMNSVEVYRISDPEFKTVCYVANKLGYAVSISCRP